MSIAEEIGKLNQLKEEGALTEEEFQKAKTDLLARNHSAGVKLKDTVDGVAKDVNMWSMFIHLSQFAGFIIPYAGFILPIVLWQIKKDESEVIDRNGRIVTNWIITETIFGIAFAVLSMIIIGIPLLIALGVCAVIFPIIGALKANNGEIWSYPLSIKFFRLDAAAALPPPPIPAAPAKQEDEESPNPDDQ